MTSSTHSTARTAVPGWLVKHKRRGRSPGKCERLRLSPPSIEKEVDAVGAGLHTREESVPHTNETVTTPTRAPPINRPRLCVRCRTKPCHRAGKHTGAQFLWSLRSRAPVGSMCTTHAYTQHHLTAHASHDCAQRSTDAMHSLTEVLARSKAAHLPQPFPFQLGS